jgi:hypothetical protein
MSDKSMVRYSSKVDKEYGNKGKDKFFIYIYRSSLDVLEKIIKETVGQGL